MTGRSRTRLNTGIAVDFLGKVQGGVVRLPKKAESLLDGKRVYVRVTERSLSRSLIGKGVTDEEIDRIASVQLEQREDVMKFLATEGAFHGRASWKKLV